MTSSLLVALAALAPIAAPGAEIGPGGNPMDVVIERKTCASSDGVTIVYSAAGAGEPALVFVHGGLADRTFWDGQLEAFASRHRVVAVDLAGHGESGVDRRVWSIPQFGADVAAAVAAENIGRAVIFGNSLGGPVAVEAARLLPGKVVGVVGVDTFQALQRIDEEEVTKRADAFRRDFRGSLGELMDLLFHADADPAVRADAERRMARTPPATVPAMFLGMAGYDEAAAVRALPVPLRSINGDLYPTDVAGVRKVKPDFDVVIMAHMGHYPMLERPEEFNRLAAEVVASLTEERPEPDR